MADLSMLGNLNPVEPLDLENYAEVKESTFQLPIKGRYTVQAPPEFPDAAFGSTKAGALSAQVDPAIVGPTNEGFKLRFVKVSAKVFKRGGLSASQLGDYLKSCGIRGKLNDLSALVDAVRETANRMYQVDVDWRAYNKTTGFSVEGMERFPSDGNGGHLMWYPDPTEKGEDGEPLRLRANLIVTRYVPLAN